MLNDSSQHLFVESIVSLHAPHSLTDDSPWTAATAYDDGAYRDWKDGEFGIEISRYVCEKDNGRFLGANRRFCMTTICAFLFQTSG